MAYRNDIDALAARDEVLTRELADKQREHAEVQRMLDEARAVEAAEARAHDVSVGRRRLRVIAVATGAVVVAGVVAGALLVQSRSPHDGSILGANELVARQAGIESAQDTAYELALAAKGLTPVRLEPRPLGGVHGFATPQELDEALGQKVEPWQPFIYTRDAQARNAIASDIYLAYEGPPATEFVSDGHGGVWRAKRLHVPTTTTAITVDACEGPVRGGVDPGRNVDRMVWVLPLASSFRGDLDVEVRAPALAITYARGGCPPAP